MWLSRRRAYIYLRENGVAVEEKAQRIMMDEQYEDQEDQKEDCGPPKRRLLRTTWCLA